MRYYITLTAVLLIGISIFTACEQSAPNTNTARTNTAVAPKTNTAEKAQPKDELADVPRISLADAKKAFDAGNAIFVDTRAEVQFQQSRIKGAINVPAEAMETRYKEIPTGKKIIAYCS
jgi:hypothetical protein